MRTAPSASPMRSTDSREIAAGHWAQRGATAVRRGVRVLSCSRRRAVAQGASSSIGCEGPFHLTAGKLRSRVIFWAVQRTKWPAFWRSRTSSLVIQPSRSVCRQEVMVRF